MLWAHEKRLNLPVLKETERSKVQNSSSVRPPTDFLLPQISS